MLLEFIVILVAFVVMSAIFGFVAGYFAAKGWKLGIGDPYER